MLTVLLPQLPLSEAELAKLFGAMAHESTRGVSWSEFRAFWHIKQTQLHRAFQALDANNNGKIDPAELTAALGDLRLRCDERTVRTMVAQMDTDGDGSITFAEFQALVMLFPNTDDLDAILRSWESVADAIDVGDTSQSKPRDLHANTRNVIVAGAVAGTISRTATAPFDRLKVLLQAGASVNGVPITGMAQGLRAIYGENGMRSFFRGNFVNCVKIAPESSVKFFAFDHFKRLLGDPDSAVQRFAAGAAAGVSSQLSIYPMEVVKVRPRGGSGANRLTRTQTRLSVAPKAYTGIVDCFVKIRAQEGVRGFYKGVGPR